LFKLQRTPKPLILGFRLPCLEDRLSAPAPPAPSRSRVRKAAPKSGARRRRRGKAAPELVVDAALLAGVPLFAGLSEHLRAQMAKRVKHHDLPRGEDLWAGKLMADDDSPVFVMLFGDVNVTRRARTGEEIVNYLSVGEVFVQKLFARDDTLAVKLTTMCPVRALQLTYRDINFLMSQDTGFRDRFMAAVQPVTQRQSDYFDNAFRKDIATFFVKERLTFAGRIKIKRMDICIECDACYDACRDRHGTDRLGASEVKYGITEIPQNCHNCVVPECMDKCKFGHISRDAETKEIIIADDCTGCTMCAKGCSYGAIRMHSLADLDVKKYFPDRSPDAIGINIAQKCDNCTGYADKACITACPTGAMFQVNGIDLFTHWKQFSVHDAPGFGEIVSPENVPVKSTRPLWLAFVLLNVLFLFWECFGRLYWPSLAFGHLFHTWGLLETDLDPYFPLKASALFGHSLGYIGGACCLATQLYRFGKRWAPRFGSVQAWMESHIWLGILGAIYGFFHTAFVLQEWVAVLTFGLMAAAVLTGIVGRWVVFLIPRTAAGDQLALDQVVTRIKAVNQAISSKFKNRDHGQTMIMRLDALTNKTVAEAAAEMPTRADDAGRGRVMSGIFKLIGEDRRQARAIEAMEAELGQKIEGNSAGVITLMKQKARLERSTRRFAFMTRVLRRYRVVHVWSSNFMFIALTAHVVLSLMYTMRA
jgi:Fe-S-cluster-containing hydrogenase component 2